MNPLIQYTESDALSSTLDLTLYEEEPDATVQVPLTRDDALDLAAETLRAGNCEAFGFYSVLALQVGS
jgi:hypothetical protein